MMRDNSRDQGPAVVLARRLGLSSTFTGLRVSGLDRMASCAGVSRRNKELIFRFLHHISAEVSEARLTFYIHKLRRLAGWLCKDFPDATEEDIRRLVTFVSKGLARQDGGRFSPGTVHGYKVTLKRFYRWLEGDDQEYPRKVRWIKANGETARVQEPEQLLTPEEVLAMIRHARSPRDKAVVAFLYESGARISEMLSMKVHHLEFTPSTVNATLPVSKTRARTVPLVSCRRHLVTWINYHPLKDDGDTPVWSNLKRDGSHALKSSSVGRILKRIAGEAGITKRVYPHLFRACSITHKQLAGWPEQAIKMFHGLSKDSKMMKHYSHLSYGNLEQIQRRMNGLPVKDEGGLNRGVKCPGCGKRNPLFVEMCTCGLPTELKRVPGRDSVPSAELEARLEKRMREFIEGRQFYDRLMERFMDRLLDKAKQSPELLKLIGAAGKGLQSGAEVQAAAASRGGPDCAQHAERHPPDPEGVQRPETIRVDPCS